MDGFAVVTSYNAIIRFKYDDDSPVTSAAFASILPFSCTFFHARVSGLEIWTDASPPLDIIQENASVFTLPGEVVIGPMKPTRAKTANCMGIYYGDGKGLDCCNIFAKVFDEDKALLAALGERIWKDGAEELQFKQL